MPRKIHPKIGTPLTLLIGATILGYGSYVALKQWQLQAWPQTEAHVVSFKPNITKNGKSFNPLIEYNYQVNGQEFRSNKLNPSPFNYQSHASLQEETGHLHPGVKAPCWYNPANPAESYAINVGVSLAPLLVIGLGLMLTGAAIYMYLPKYKFDEFNHFGESGRFGTPRENSPEK
jgi:hypothetical protein